MTKKLMICRNAEHCENLANFYAEIVCRHMHPHEFLRPGFKDNPIHSCLPRVCPVTNEVIRCIPYEKEIPESKFECPLGYENGFNVHDDDCMICELNKNCLKALG